MGGRAYTTKDVYVDGIKVSVRQILFKGNDRVPDQIGEIVRLARRWIAITLTKITPQGNMHAVRQGAGQTSFNPEVFEKFFKHKPDPAQINTVRAVLGTIHTGLSASFGVKIRQMDGTRGAVTPYYPMSLKSAPLSMRKFGKCCKVDGMLWYDKDDDQLHSKGEIHLSNHILGDGPDAVRTFIHEAGHKFANLYDHAYLWQQTKFDALSSENCLRNADSYAHFVLNVAAVSQQRADRHAANAADDSPLGLDSLFS